MTYNPDDGRYAPGTVIGSISSDGRDMLVQIAASDWETPKIYTALRKLTALPKKPLKQRDPENTLRLPLTWAIVTQLAQLAEEYGFLWRPQPDLGKWIYDEFMNRHAEYEDGVLKADLSGLERTPMPHQSAGAYVASLNHRFFLADDMGTGKSGTALLTLAEMEARGMDPFPAFIVTPASVVDQFLDEEIPAWFPDWPAVAYRGPKRRMLSSRYKLYVMSWDVFRTDMQQPEEAECATCSKRSEWSRKLQKQLDASLLAPDSYSPPRCPCGGALCPVESKTMLPPLIDFLVPRTLVLDEAHALCNVKTRQSVAARRCARVAEHALLMSGTPITHDVGGFWSALNVLDIKSFPDQDRYKERYADTHPEDYGPRVVDGLTTTHRDEFHTLMQGTMRRVAKADVLTDLPPKTYQTRIVHIPPAYRKAYDEMQEDMIAHIPDTDEPLPVINTLVQMQRLSQLASSACDVEIEMVPDEKEGSLTFGEMVPHYKVSMREPCWKADELMAVMEEADGQPIVTFAPHTQLIEIAGARAGRAGYRVGYIKGGQSMSKRTRTRKAFQDGELDLLCVNPASGGVGLNLTTAHIAVFLERPWAFWNSSQAEDRIHRRGQTEQVTIIDIIATNTIESRVRQALHDKAQQLSDLIRDPRVVKELLGGQPLTV